MIMISFDRVKKETTKLESSKKSGARNQVQKPTSQKSGAHLIFDYTHRPNFNSTKLLQTILTTIYTHTYSTTTHILQYDI